MQQMPSLRKPIPGNPAVHGMCSTVPLTWLSCLYCMGVREPWLPWAEVQGLALVGDLCVWCDLPCQQAHNTSQIQPPCCVSWDFTLEVNLVHAVNYKSQQSKMSSHHSEVAAEVWFCSPLSAFLLSFNSLLSFFLCVSLSPLSFTCLLRACFPISLIRFSASLLQRLDSLPFHSSFCRTKSLALLFFFSLHQPLRESPYPGLCGWPVVLCSRELWWAAMKGWPARPDNFEKAESGSRAFSSFLFSSVTL